MSQELSFRDLIDKVRAGDGQAAAEPVQRFEPHIRRLVRRRLTNLDLPPVLDSMDICQSVFGRFFVWVASGQDEVDTPERLRKVLVTMTLNKIRNLARKA